MESFPVGLPATLAGFEDRASFLVFVNEERLGTMRSEWRGDGSFEARSSITFAGQTIVGSLAITPDASGRWERVVTRAPDGVRTSTREGSLVTRRFQGATLERTSSFEVAAEALLFDNDAPALMGQAIRLYDRVEGGAQRFPLMIGGRPPVELILEAKGAELGLTRFAYRIPGVSLDVWADEAGRICLVEIPAQKAVLVREGYERLRAPAAVEGGYVLETVRVPMRDGMLLATDLYHPVGVGRAPVILLRTPYKKELSELQAKFFARRGFVVAVQDCRGCFASPGTFEPLVHEGSDGYDTIEWLAGQPYSNGRVGMIGASYLGAAQWLAAVQRPPHLVTLIPCVSPTDPFYNAPYDHGVLFLWGALWWADVLESEAGADASGAAIHRTWERRYATLLRTLPVVDLDRALLGKENRYWRTWIEHAVDDDYWEPATFLDKLKDVRLPVFQQSGWFDLDGIGTKLNYLKMAGHGHPHQKLTLGPWGHTDAATRLAGDRDFGEEAIVDLQAEYLRWFERWLVGTENGIEKEPLVNLFVMGANRWRRGATYPLEGTELRKLYLTSAGKLSFAPPAADAPPARYVYDPGDPTPDPRAYQESEEDAKRVRSAEERKREAEKYARRIAAERRDILVYETDPLTEPLTIAGPLSAVLHASTSAVDTDWFVRLYHVGTNGKLFPLALGKIRARFRKSMKAPQLLEPGEIVEYAIDLWQTGLRLAPGERLRVEIASAAFPMFSRNLNTGGHNETETRYVTAEQTVYHDAGRASHLVLPVLPEE